VEISPVVNMSGRWRMPLFATAPVRRTSLPEAEL
jgi:hypothetical protein